MLKFTPLLLLLVLALSVYFYLPLKRVVAYSLGVSGDTTHSCCNVAEILRADGKFDENASIAIFNGQSVDYPKTSLAQNINENLNTDVLGTKNAAGEEKWIEVSLDKQLLTAWEGSKIVMQFAISSGRWFPTPTGDYNIWYKTRSQRMVGGSKELGTFYDLPNVPYNMFFNQGFAVHGAYWHNNFGHPMSHGCVNAPVANAAQLFDWSGPVVPLGKNTTLATTNNPGTRVFVH